MQEIESGVTKNSSQEFSVTKSYLLGALSWLDWIFVNLLVPGHSGSLPETSRRTPGRIQRTNEDRSQNDPHHVAKVLSDQVPQDFGPDGPCDSNLEFWSVLLQ